MKYLLPAVLFVCAACNRHYQADSDPRPLLFIGTYTQNLGFVDGKGAGIYTCRFNSNDGVLSVTDTASGIDNPSFLALSPDKKCLYAVSETGGKPEAPYGSVVAYRIGAGGALKKINAVSSYGVAPCHISVDPGGRYVFVANYASGNVVSYRIGAGGVLSDSLSAHSHIGANPHAHMIIPVPGHPDQALSVDKGADQLLIYRLQHGRLSPLDSLRLASGEGPRHFAFHPVDNTLGFVINENSSSLASVRFDKSGRHPLVMDRQSTLPPGFTGKNTCADVHVHPNGRYVYGSNRGHNSIAVFEADTATGKLTLLGCESTQGALPRNFMITPDGNWLLVANQNSGTVVSFQIDPATGRLKPAGPICPVPTPVCLKIGI